MDLWRYGYDEKCKKDTKYTLCEHCSTEKCWSCEGIKIYWDSSSTPKPHALCIECCDKVGDGQCSICFRFNMSRYFDTQKYIPFKKRINKGTIMLFCPQCEENELIRCNMCQRVRRFARLYQAQCCLSLVCQKCYSKTQERRKCNVCFFQRLCSKCNQIFKRLLCLHCETVNELDALDFILPSELVQIIKSYGSKNPH